MQEGDHGQQCCGKNVGIPVVKCAYGIEDELLPIEVKHCVRVPGQGFCWIERKRVNNIGIVPKPCGFVLGK